MAINKAKIISDIKEAGFSHVKFEFEGHLNLRFDVNYCHDFIMERLERHGLSRRKLNVFHGSHGVVSRWWPKGPMTYAEFYRDGSVDSEFTFTIDVDQADKVQHVFEAWNELVEHNGNGIDIRGAGMHIATLLSGEYPGNRHLDELGAHNFKSEVTKLLPALFIGATSGNFTRALRFRVPQVTHHTKYSAIYTRNDTSIEYRLFETCYQRIETYWEYLGVIARTLEYYKEPRKKVVPIGKTFKVFENGTEHLGGWLSFSEQIQIIKKQFKYVKPEGMTAKEFFSHRGISMMIKEVREKEEKEKERLKLAYQEHKMAHKKVRDEPLDEYEMDAIAYWKMEAPGHTEDWYWERVTGRKGKVESQATYIKNNTTAKQIMLASVRC